MVDITIFIEGVKSENSDVLTVDNTVAFRENFYKLFSQKLSSTEFNLIIQPFGSITRAKYFLEYIEKNKINAVILIDLDASKEKRDERLQHYDSYDTTKIFFMIQEMEAWILSQVDKIELFGKIEGLERKKYDDIGNNPLIRNKHPEEIIKPSKKLDTILRQYFNGVKIRHGKERKIGKRYSKAKDGAKLIGLLELQILMEYFDEVKMLVESIARE